MKAIELKEKIRVIQNSASLAKIKDVSVRNKTANYPLILIERILDCTDRIIKEENYTTICEYYLKPTIEHYINLKNIKDYGCDYIYFLVADGILKSRWKYGKWKVYKRFGETKIISGDSMAIKDDLEKICGKIQNEDIKALIYKPNFEKNGATIASKIGLMVENNVHLNKEYIEVLNDIANKNSHSNPRYDYKSKTDESLAKKELYRFTDYILSEIEEYLESFCDNFSMVSLIPDKSSNKKNIKPKKDKKSKNIIYKYNEKGQIVLQPKRELLESIKRNSQ